MTIATIMTQSSQETAAFGKAPATTKPGGAPTVAGRIPDIQLAPMEGVLDWVFRELLSEVGGLDRMVTEFVRVTDKLLPDHVFHRYSPELRSTEDGHRRPGHTRAGTPVFVQLLGGQPGPMAENARRVAELGAPGIDLNFGCPAKTVNRHDGGAALLRQPERLRAITSAVRNAVPSPLPVTAKVRLGYDSKTLQNEIAHAVEEGGADHIVVHARTKTEMYTPPAHWECIARMAEGRAISFLANGDIFSRADYERCRSVSGTARVALGRGLIRRPTLAHEIRAALGGGELAAATAASAWNAAARAAFLRRFFEASLAYRGAPYAVARLKQMLRYWAADKPDPLDLADAPDENKNPNPSAQWFAKGKLLASAAEATRFLQELNRNENDDEGDKNKPYKEEETKWPHPQSKFTPGPTALTAFAPKTS